MKINNVSSQTSLQSIVTLSIINILIISASVGSYILMNKSDYSIYSFWQWLVSIYQLFCENCPDKDAWMPPVVMILLPIGSFVSLIYLIISRQNALKLMQNTLNLNSVNFHFDKVDFKFNRPGYDFICGYDNINKLKMILHTELVHTKSGSYIALREIELCFKLLGNKEFSIKNTPAFNKMGFIYKIIDYSKKIKSFSYEFKGAGVSEDLKEKIDDYKTMGLKQILSKPAEERFITLSLIFFIMGLIIFFTTEDTLMAGALERDLWFFMFIPLFFIVISFIPDIYLVADKIKELRYNKPIGQVRFPFFIVAVKFFIVLFVFFSFIFPVLNTAQSQKNVENIINTSTGELVKLGVNQPSSYSFLSKQEIYNIRKKYVKRSIFAKSDYEPNESIFGGIVDNRPWWNNKLCSKLDYNGDYHERIEGDSKVSIQVNNPNALVTISPPYTPWYVDENKSFCDSEYSKFIPYSISYSNQNNIIVIKYMLPMSYIDLRSNINNKSVRFPLQLSGLNALDFGYRYVNMYNKENIKMSYPENSVYDDIKEFTDYIHLGGSCRYEGGCNNISPMQNDKMFSIYDLPAKIDLKLWKKQPKNKFIKPDMYYRIIFEPTDD